MGKVGNVPTDIQDGIQDALGHKMKIAFARKVNFEVKPDKFDDRVLALNDHRVFIFTPKIPMKLETSLHFLDINLLESKSPKKMIIGTELKRHVMISNSPDESTDEFDRAVGHIIVSLAKVFPNVSPDKLIAKVDFMPPSRLQDFRRIGADIGLRDEGPCGNFSTMYRCMCDYHNMDVQEDVAWDVDMIYLSQDSKEMNLKDFDHLDNRHLIPIISALEHNTWFTRLNTSNVKLSPEAINEILKIMKTNTAIEELVLANINIPADFCQRLCMSLVVNTGSPLTTLDLSGNIIGDRGLNHLCGPITKLSRGLVELNLARTGITARGVNKLSEALLSNRNIPLNLRILDLSENSFKGEDVSNLFNFLAQPNVLTDLRLAATECSLESLFAALQRGCAQNLANLDVSNNFFSYKKQGKDVSVPSSWKQFFASAISLKNINFSGCRLPPDALRSILEGIGSNPSLTNVELNLSSNGFGLPGNQGGHVLEMHLCSIGSVSHLDLSDNGFDVGLANILEKLNQNKSLRKLSIGRNLNNIKPKHVPQIIEAVIQLIHHENSPIRCLNVDNLRLKTETVLLINALGTNDTLTEIDISGNQMGDLGCRMLSKALQLNKKLCIIYWDHNGTSPHGFQDIAAALEKNFTLHKMPTPINDAVQALRINQEKTEQALQKIESVLQRNHSNRKLHTGHAFRLHQCFMINTLKQTMEVHLSHLQETIEKYENLQQKYQLGTSNSSAQEEVTKAQALLKEADCAKTLFLQLQRIIQESECSNSLQKNLKSLGSSLCDVVTKQLKANISAMVACAAEQFPVTLKNEALQEELTSSEKNCQLSVEFVQNLISDQLSADVANKMSELNLLAASHISECILEEIINEVEKSAHSLKSLLNSARSQLLLSGQLKDEDAESKEHRENLKRHKPSVTTDEDQDAATDMPSISNKHKSQLNRRLRPQSAVDAADVKRALELCRGKTEFSASSDLELRIDSGHERSSSEERVLESDDSKGSSPVPTPLPRKRRGQPIETAKGDGSGSKPGHDSSHDKTAVGKRDSPHKKSSNADHVDNTLQNVSSRSQQHSEHDSADFGTTSPVDTARVQHKTEPGTLGGSNNVLQSADEQKFNKSLLEMEDILQAIVNSGEVLQKAACKASGLAHSSSEVLKGDEKLEKASNCKSVAQPSKATVEEKAEVLKLEELPKISGRSSVKMKESSVDHDNGKNLGGKAAESSVHTNGKDLFLRDEVSAPRLKHLATSRPKRPKNNAVTRPIAFDPVIDENDVSRGFSEFFGAKPLLPAERRENGELTVHEVSDEVVKSETSNKKEKSKAAAFSPKLESKGFASNLMNRFKKKPSESDTAQLTQKSSDGLAISDSSQTLQKNEEKPSDCGDLLKPSEGESKKEAEEPLESRPKQPPGVAKICLPGMTGGINLEELRRKKAAAKHVPNPTEGLEEKEAHSPEKKSSQPKDGSELPSAEDGNSGALSHRPGSVKVRLPPPLAPKPNKRASTGASASASAPSAGATAATDAPKPAVPITRGLSEAEETQEPEQKADVHQGIDAAAFDRKKRFSVREKAASIDKNSNLKSEGSSSNKKSVTPTAENSAKSSESLVHQLSGDSSVGQASPSLSTTGPESETSVLDSDLPCDADNDGDVKSNAAAKRLSDIDLIDT